MRNFSIYNPEYDARVLITAFLTKFFEKNSPMKVKIPELSGYIAPDIAAGERLKHMSVDDNIEQLLTISENFVGVTDRLSDSQLTPRFPLLMVTYPEFTDLGMGIGAQINHFETTYRTDQCGQSFMYYDVTQNENVVLSYATEYEREWIVRRFHNQFSINIDIITETPEARKILSDLVRALFSQYLADSSRFLQISQPIFITGYQYDRDDKSTLSGYNDTITGEPYYYPAYFPYAQLPITFDLPIVTGTGTYDQINLFGTENLYVSTFSIEQVRLEALQSVEVDPYPFTACYVPNLGEKRRIPHK